MDQQLKNRRLAAVKAADAINAIEGVPVSDYVRSLSDRWAEGEITARGSPKDLLFHSDRGTQYTGHKFRSLLHDCGVTQSFSAPGVPYDNAPMESFFGSLKTEEVHRYRYHGISDLAVSLHEYLNFYNHKRPHSSISNQTPTHAEEIYFKKQNAVSISADCVPFACKK